MRSLLSAGIRQIKAPCYELRRAREKSPRRISPCRMIQRHGNALRRKAASYDALFFLPDRPAAEKKRREPPRHAVSCWLEPGRKFRLKRPAENSKPVLRSLRRRKIESPVNKLQAPPSFPDGLSKLRPLNAKTPPAPQKGNGRRFLRAKRKTFPAPQRDIHLSCIRKARKTGRERRGPPLPGNTTDEDRQSPRAAASRSPPRPRAQPRSPARAIRQEPETSSERCCTGGWKVLPP